MWLSPEQQIWAFRLGGSSYFYNGLEQVKYEFREGDKSITKLPLGEDNAQRVLSMNALSHGKAPSVIGCSERRRSSRKSGGRLPKRARPGSSFE